MCKAIYDMIEDGRLEGKIEGKAEAVDCICEKSGMTVEIACELKRGSFNTVRY